jgi:hypothetical protein
MAGYIYIIQLREFINSNTPVYKIGKTKQPNFERFKSYPKNSVMLAQICCKDCNSCERNVISFFDNKYKKRSDIGREYYEGDYRDMICDINSIIDLKKEITVEIVSDLVNEIVGNIIENIKEPVPIIKPVNEIMNTKFCCKNCGYFTDNKQNYERHQVSEKHKYLSNKKEENEKIFECKNCNRKFITNGGLWKHNKTCQVKKDSQNNVSNDTLICNLIEDNRDKILQILLKNTDC